MTGGPQDIPLDPRGSSDSRTWQTDIALLVSNAALAVLGFLWLVVLIKAFRLELRLGNLLVFVASISALPAGCAAIQYWVGRYVRQATKELFESINIWCAVLALLALAVVGVATWASGGIGFWQRIALHTIQAVLGVHLALVAAIGLGYARPAHLKLAESRVLRFSSRSAQAVAFGYAFAAAVIALFRIEPGNKHFNGLFSVFFPSPPSGFPGSSQLAIAALLSISSMIIAAGLLIIERRLERHDPALLLPVQKLALPLAAAVAVVFFFDFSLAADALHYMTNIGPALRLMSGGTLMVDTFSQYGPGPVLLMYAAFQIGPPSFAVANIAVQLCNLLFYILFLIALWRSTRHKLAAMWLGLVVLTFWLSGWAYGEGNVNAAPSVLGVRYLPAMLMTVALSTEAKGNRHSILTFLASFLATFWSAEAVAAVLALHCGFLTLVNLRDLSFRRLVVDLALACVPVVIGLIALSLIILLASGELPAFAIYLGYFSSYNPIAQFWSVPFTGLFWGWIPFLLAIVVAVGVCCLTVIGGRSSELPHWTDCWLRRALPAAMLTALTSAYFSGRSVDFVILIALLPLSLLLIPASLWLANVASSRDRFAAGLLAIPLIAFLWMSSYSLLYLFRVGSPYSLVVQECRDHGRCTPASLSEGISETLRRQLALEPETDIFALTSYDRGIAADAKRLIDRFAAEDAEVTVLLGESGGGIQMLSDIAMMYAGKRHTWPRSFTFTDELVPELAARILAAPVKLRTGNVIVLRRDETNLGPLEGGILRLIRSTGSLCSLDGSTSEIAAYRYWKNGDPQPAGSCIGWPAGTVLDVSDAEREALEALPAFIRNIRSLGDTLPNGPIDPAILRRAGVEVPSLFVRGDRLVAFWGGAAIFKTGKYLTLDLFGIRRSVCRNLLAGVSRISGVLRVATTGTMADERGVPVTDEQAAQACAQHSGLIRLIVDTHP